MKRTLVLIFVLSSWCIFAAQTASTPQPTQSKTTAAKPKQARTPHKRYTETHPGYVDCEWQSGTDPGKTCVLSIEWLAQMTPSSHDPIWLDHNDTVVWISQRGTPFVLGEFRGEDCKTYQQQDNGEPFDNDFKHDTASVVKMAHFNGKKGACWEHIILVNDKPYLKPHPHLGDKDKDKDKDKDDKDKDQARTHTIDPHIFGGSDQ